MGKKLLLIDDDISANQTVSVPGVGVYMWYYAEELRDTGYEVTEVNSVDRAIEILASQSFDLILLDLMMPPGKSLAEADTATGMRTGVVFAERLAQSHPDIPVVILTMVASPSATNALHNKPNVKKILQKTENPPSAIVEEIREILRL